MLTVHDDRRSRSKSPSGRDRSRSHSRDTRARSPPKKEYKRSSRRYSESDSDTESEDDRRRRRGDRKSTKKYDSDSDSSEDHKRRHTKSSKKYSESESEESDRYRSSKKTKEKKDKKRSESDSESHRRRSKKDKSSKKNSKDSESSDSDDISISIHRKSKSTRDSEKTNGLPSNYTQPVAVAYAPPPGYVSTYSPAPTGSHDTRHLSYVGSDPRYAAAGTYLPNPAAPPHQRTGSFSGGNPPRYAEVDKYQYAQPDPNVGYRYKDDAPNGPQFTERRSEYERRRERVEYEQRPRDKSADDRYEVREPKDRKYAESRHDRPGKKYHDDKYSSSPDDLSRKMTHLAVGGALGAASLRVATSGSYDGGKPPASPLLEAYKGTYQSISPMPSALVLANHRHDSDLSDLDLDSDSDFPSDDLKRKIRQLEKEKAKYQKEKEKEKANQGKTIYKQDLDVEIREPGRRSRASSDVSTMVISPTSTKKKVSFYDPTSDAKKIAAALQGTRNAPDVKPLIQILPHLSTDDLMALRAEYKNYAKVSGQGINIAKHIKMRVSGSLGKAAYATALGRWESEAYWANSWYQGGASRRELLIESLMGRSNSDIREIKNCFKDKKYNDDLEKCIRTELKADKFRSAILLALEEKRMPESMAVDIQLVKEDVQALYKALTSSGGETAMIQIIVVRSDSHLREVLRLFERTYNLNFAREMIAKSRNLVGETLAHILNGALNRPMRDALLLHQAIVETAPGKERTELLISRLVRLHWEPKHLERVKAQYEQRYKTSVEVAIQREVWAAMKTPEGRQCAEFCIELARSSSQ